MPPKTRANNAKRGRPRGSKKVVKSAEVVDVSSGEEEAPGGSKTSLITPPKTKNTTSAASTTPRTGDKKRRFEPDSEEDAAAAPSQDDVRTSPKKPKTVRDHVPSEVIAKLPKPEVFINASPKKSAKVVDTSDEEDVFSSKPKPRGRGSKLSVAARKYIDDQAVDAGSDDDDDGEDEDLAEDLESDSLPDFVFPSKRGSGKQTVQDAKNGPADDGGESDAVVVSRVAKKSKMHWSDSDQDAKTDVVTTPKRKNRKAIVVESDSDSDDKPLSRMVVTKAATFALQVVSDSDEDVKATPASASKRGRTNRTLVDNNADIPSVDRSPSKKLKPGRVAVDSDDDIVVSPVKKGKQKKVVSSDSESDVNPMASPGSKGRRIQVDADGSDDSTVDAKTTPKKGVVKRAPAPTSLPSPDVCGVASLGAAVWDPDLKKTYKDLPKLILAQMATSSSDTSDASLNLYLFEYWSDASDIRALKKMFAFSHGGIFVNPSRVDPAILTVARDHSVVKFLGTDTIACMLSLVFVQKSQLQSPGPPNAQGKESKSLIGVFHIHEFERYCSTLGMVFGVPQITGPLYRGGFRFGTVASVPQNDHVSSPTKGFRPSTSAVTTSEPKFRHVLYIADTIPVYDGRALDFDIDQDFQSVLRRLPRIDGELCPESLALVGYTVTRYTQSGSPVKNQASFNQNIMFAVLLVGKDPM
ncbi:hypothetical protein PLICRDRAFT_172413 [Plicaturopsis crispa FD-325 SS-3]|nr:hypothetical protein PLICRDRAFT_172413 [Plicaturopsis crispa FD-325 SS-3]